MELASYPNKMLAQLNHKKLGFLLSRLLATAFKYLNDELLKRYTHVIKENCEVKLKLSFVPYYQSILEINKNQ